MIQGFYREIWFLLGVGGRRTLAGVGRLKVGKVTIASI
jgi:hypothetical protein